MMERRGFLASLAALALAPFGLGLKGTEFQPPVKKGTRIFVSTPMGPNRYYAEMRVKFGNVQDLDGCFLGFAEAPPEE